MLNPISLFCCRRPEIEPQQELHINVQEDGDSPENSRNVPADSLDSSSLHSEDIRSTSQQSSRKEANILETRAFFLRYEPEIRFKRRILKAGSEDISQSKKNHLLNAGCNDMISSLHGMPENRTRENGEIVEAENSRQRDGLAIRELTDRVEPNPIDDTPRRSVIANAPDIDENQVRPEFERVDGELPYKFGHYYFTHEQAVRFSRGQHYVKQSGSLFNPSNWPAFCKYLFSGAPQRTTGMQALSTTSRAQNVGLVTDGLDDAVNTLQGSGISRQLVAALRAFLFYPLILPLVNMGATGSRNELHEARHDLAASAAELARQKDLLIRKLADIRPAMAERLNNASSDSDFCRLLIDALRRIPAELRHGHAEQMAEFLQDIARYKTALDTHLLARLRNHATPAAVAGTHAMLAGVLLYEMGVLADFSAASATQGTAAAVGGSAANSVAANFMIGPGAQGAAAVFKLIGHFVMTAGQIATAVYGGIEAAGAIKKHQMLAAMKKVVSESELIDPATKKDLLAQVGKQQTYNFFGKILANIGLVLGQIFMLLGGPLVGFGLPLLMVGAVLTIAAFIIKVSMQKLHDKHFSYDPATFNAPELLGARSLEDAVAIVENKRRLAMKQMGWLGILGALEKIKATHARAPMEKMRELLTGAVGSLYKNNHEQQVRAATLELFNDPDNEPLFDLCLQNATPGLTSYLTLLLTAADEPLPARQAIGRINDFIHASRHERMTQLLDLSETANIETEMQRRLVQQLVVKEHSCSNSHGSDYRDFLRSEKVVLKRKWLRNTTKTVYSVDMNVFCERLEQAEADDVRDHVEREIHRATRKALGSSHAYQVRSRLYGANERLMMLASAKVIRDALEQPEHNPGGEQVHLNTAPDRIMAA